VCYCILYHGFFFQVDDGIRVPLWSRGLGDVYKTQNLSYQMANINLKSLNFGVNSIFSQK
ncbi:hypothetical protein, partial [Campylobacter concisus]|uniref:hypothetical protein n=1 Tax=Campylobacter concisus TaxID=199 RepID=UPI001F212ED4